MSTRNPGCASASNFCRTLSWESRILTHPGSFSLEHCTRVDCGITEPGGGGGTVLYLWECRVMNKEKCEENFRMPISRSRERDG